MPFPFKHFRFLFHVLTICRPFMIRPSTTTGSDGLDRDLDCGSNWTPDWIGSDRTGIFAFSAEELFWEKLFFNMTQVVRNTKSEFLKLESNLRLVQTRLDCSNRFDSEFFFRAALLIPANLLIVSSERYLHLSPPSSIRAMSRDQASFWNCNRMKLCNRKFPSAIQLKIMLCDDFQADGEF